MLLPLFMLIVLPGVFLVILWKAAFKSKLEWILDAATTFLLIMYLFQSANWSWVWYGLRYVWVVLFVLALGVSLRKVRSLQMVSKESKRFTYGLYGLLIIVFGFYNINGIRSHFLNEPAIDLAFPLKEGTYYIGHGGNHPMMNYHQAYPDQKYALDIIGLYPWGTRAKGYYPTELEKYAIFGHELYSPCDGEVTGAVNDLPDLRPSEMDPEHAEGNHVLLLCDGHEATILLAHMQEGSVAVSEGDRVETGQLLGKVGNSGNTSEPHLHIHAELDGAGVPVTFDGQFPVRNQLMKTGK